VGEEIDYRPTSSSPLGTFAFIPPPPDGQLLPDRPLPDGSPNVLLNRWEVLHVDAAETRCVSPHLRLPREGGSL
jgi:hypothetical protein